jgi:hypothetical protein
MEKKPQKSQKKQSAKLENVRKFVIVHPQGQDEIFSTSDPDARLQGHDLMKQKGMKPQERIDFYEVKT